MLLFAAVSGDTNPVHLDEQFASGTQFKGRIAHGMYTAGLISAAIAMELPGPGTIYLGQDLLFERPVRIGDTLTVQLAVCPPVISSKAKFSSIDIGSAPAWVAKARIIAAASGDCQPRSFFATVCGLGCTTSAEAESSHAGNGTGRTGARGGGHAANHR